MNQLTVYFCPKDRRFNHEPPDGEHYSIIHSATAEGLKLEVRHPTDPNSINIEIGRDGMVVTTTRELHFRRSGQVRQITSTDGLGRAAAAGD